MVKVATAAVALLLLAGCSSGKTVTTSTRTLPPSTPSSSTSAASVSQYASMVSSGKASIDNAASQIAQCNNTAYDPTDLACNIGRHTYALTVETLDVDLMGAAKPGAGQYIGPPPTELAGILETTHTAFAGMKSADDSVQTACKASETDACDAALFRWTEAKSEVDQALAGWSPYTH